MTGAMAGSTVLHFDERTDTLRVVTLTVNNLCNLRCPHCYLQYDGDSDCISDDLARLVTEADYEHLAIVGKEPLVNRTAAKRCQDLITRAAATGKSVSLITNGLGLAYLPAQVLSDLAWIDVSLDGGPSTYAMYRGASYSRLSRNLNWLFGNGFEEVNALNTLSYSNIGAVDDMMLAGDEFPFKRILFSPYVETLNQGSNSAAFLPLETLCSALRGSEQFLASIRASLILGAHTYSQFGVSRNQIDGLLRRHFLHDKTVIVNDDPLNLGILRVTYDGLVLTPYESLHTAKYLQVGRSLTSPGELSRHYRRLVSDVIYC